MVMVERAFAGTDDGVSAGASTVGGNASAMGSEKVTGEAAPAALRASTVTWSVPLTALSATWAELACPYLTTFVRLSATT